MWPTEEYLKTSSVVDAKTKAELLSQLGDSVIANLTEKAAKIPIDESGIVAIDWMNGRRTPDANQALKGAISGLNLGSDAPAIFKSLVEATCFGSKKIVDRFISEGIPIKKVVALGGVAKKSPYVMQVMADVLNMPIKVAKSEQTPALGAAMLAATAAGIYPDAESAKKAMGAGFDAEYFPIPENVVKYMALYEKYTQLGAFMEKN
jgi:L-ribulokinase